MEEELEVILRAVDDASSTFESVADSATEMGESIENVASEGNAGLGNLQESAEEAASGLGDVQGSAEDAGYSMEQLIDYCQNMYAGKIEEVANETERAREESDEAGDSFSNLSNILSGIAGAEIFSKLADTLWDFADKAGSFEDSMMRARLEAEGAGISVNEMTDTVSELSRVTGRAGGEIRESFIKATARGITDMDSFKKMMVGAGAQATLLGTDIQSMGDKFSSMAMRSTLMERQLASTGITMEELGNAMGLTGATADEVKAKWEELDTNQRAAALGMAASMNEGQTANDEYKKSWAGLQEQIDIAKGRLERLAGEVLLPVLIPALQVAGRVLNWLGDTVSAVMSGPLGGLISVIGSAAAAFALAVPAYMAVQGAITLLEATAIPAATALWGMVAPLLPFILIGAAVVLIIYEIGKAFGWWTDAGSAIDAIWAGLQRLWSAFINHPDVQGFLTMMGQAWNVLSAAVGRAVSWVMSFFNNNSSGKFDIVRALIDGIGLAWKQITLPIRLVITVVKLFISTMVNIYNRVRAIITNIKNIFSRLPGAIRGAISSIANIIAKPFRDAYSKVTAKIDEIKNYVNGLKDSISLGSIVDKITQPFRDAYNAVAKEVDKIKDKANEISGGLLGGFFGGEDLGGAYGGEDLPLNSTSYTSGEWRTTNDINLTLDLRNVPSTIDEYTLRNALMEGLTSKEVLNVLVNNNDFQTLDNKAKNRLMMKQARSRGA